MQSEELDDSSGISKAHSPTLEMTINVTGSPKLEPQFSCDTDFSLDRIKLESYIEKIIPESPPCSDIIEEDPTYKDMLPDVAEANLEQDPFQNVQEQHSNESIRSWLQRITHMQNEIQKKMGLEHNAVLGRSPSEPANNKVNAPVPKANKVLKYEDLPYMGEMTLDNSKPRRGRKPKKADICHLIYKNYGTILSGAPDSSKEPSEPEHHKKKQSSAHQKETAASNTSKNSVQNKIISSLLEKRLTQETRRTESLSESLIGKPTKPRDQNQDEPLNLCIRDLNHLKIRLLRKNNKTYTSDVAEIKSEPHSDDEVEFINETSSLSSPDTINPPLGDYNPSTIPADSKALENGVTPAGYIYWPNAGVFIHPMALQQQLLYYQRMAATNNYTLPSHSPRPPPEGAAKPAAELRKLAPKLRPKKQEHEEPAPYSPEPKTKRTASNSSEKAPIKRKRSAIFIPPIPTENQTNPATEVSICKFKFTGGAKPSLQEKKMLSVDSGGNFRYYSGTGDKSMRGYEFFPRETLQQQVESAHGSSTGAFLQASGEKIFPPPIDFAGKQGNSEVALAPEITSPSLSSVQDLNSRHKKRKSRKSLQREKLEQTFKEKGFLIQTQQLESAEGATYCKFRQLRKFTRYLFRSWKDYLPGSVRELNEGEEENVPDLEDLARLSANELSSSDLNGPL